LIRLERERELSQSSFSSDLQIFHELDDISGTIGAETFSKSTILTFLKSKGWIIHELEDVVDDNSEEVNWFSLLFETSVLFVLLQIVFNIAQVCFILLHYMFFSS